MLQFKNVFELQPSVQGFANLMASLTLRHFQISQLTDAQITPEQLIVPKKPSEKRKIARRDYTIPCIQNYWIHGNRVSRDL